MAVKSFQLNNKLTAVTNPIFMKQHNPNYSNLS